MKFFTTFPKLEILIRWKNKPAIVKVDSWELLANKLSNGAHVSGLILVLSGKNSRIYPINSLASCAGFLTDLVKKVFSIEETQVTLQVCSYKYWNNF